jgi:hypothetical protein
MPSDFTPKARRMMIGRYAEWIKTFDVTDYIQNPPMIEKLFEEKQLALSSSFDLEKQVKELESQVYELKLQNQKLELEVAEASRKSFIMFSLSLLATVLLGIGVNIATSTPNGWAGWIMIVTAFILEAVAFFSRPQKGK